MTAMKILRLIGGLCLSLMASAAQSAELKIFGSRVTKVIVGELGPPFTKATGLTPVVVADVAAVMKRRIEAGEPFDMAVLVNFQTDDLIKQGKLIADSRADIMSSGIGVAVKRGAPKPDISTVEALRKTLLAAKSIAYSDSSSGTYLSTVGFKKLGVAEAVAGKSRKVRGPPTGEPVAAVVARGEAEIGFQQVPELINVPGADFVGRVPAEIQPPTYFVGVLTKTAQQPEAAVALLRFLSSQDAVPVITKAGLTPVAKP
jgi:molybdate transport system substrate-binding protein